MKRTHHGLLFRVIRKMAILFVAMATASCLSIWFHIKDSRVSNVLFGVIAFGTYISVVQIEASLRARRRSSKMNL